MTLRSWRVRGVGGERLLQVAAGSRSDFSARTDARREIDRLLWRGLQCGDPEVRRVLEEMHHALRGTGRSPGSWTYGPDYWTALAQDLRFAARCGALAVERVQEMRSRGANPRSDDALLPKSRRAAERPPERLLNPRWSAPVVQVGSEVSAIVSYADIRAPVSATIVVSEVEAGARKEVARIATKVPTGTGDHTVRWSRSPDAAHADLEQESSGQGGPLEYRFHVEATYPTCPGESGRLWLTNTVTVILVKEHDRQKHTRARTVVLRDAVGQEQRVRSSHGAARFEKVLVGPVNVRLAVPTFTSLSWSATTVPLGKPVDAVFHYADATAGMEALVVVYEVTQDGGEFDIESKTVVLSAVAGEARTSFTRTEDQAARDVAVDEQEGDAGPLEYRFRVVADEEWSEQSHGLWLTHAVSIKLDDPSGRTFAHGQHLILVAADGAEHRAAIARGNVRFDDVVFGPMIVRLERATMEATPRR